MDLIVGGEMLSVAGAVDITGRPARDLKWEAEHGALEAVRAGSELWFDRRSIYEWLADEAEIERIEAKNKATIAALD